MKLWWQTATTVFVITEDNDDLSGEMATFVAGSYNNEYQEPKYRLSRSGTKDELLTSKENDLNCTIKDQAGNVIYSRLNDEIYHS